MSTPEALAGALELVRSLIETRTFRKERLEDPDVREALDTLGQVAKDGSDHDKLSAVAALGKAGEISKPVLTAVSRRLLPALEAKLPLVADWGNAEDRYYLAKAVSASQADWIPGYAATALAHTEINEKLSRDAWAQLAIGRASDLSGALQVLSASLSEWLEKRGDTAELAYRKLIRVCEALNQTLLTADVPSGNGFGQAFSRLVVLAGGGKGAEMLRVREDAAVAVLDLVVQVLRLRFDILLDSDMYRAVGTVRGWWRPARPSEAVESRADRIAILAVRGLHVLARQGVRDKELRAALAKALDAARVNSAGAAVAEADPSLEPVISKWLATGQELMATRSSDAFREVNEKASDELLGRLMIAIRSQDVVPETITGVADAIELFEPNQAAVIRKAAGRLQLIQQWVDALAARRRLNLYTSRGDLVQFDPLLHDAPMPLQRNSNARVAVPGVTKDLEGRPPEIIVKAVVDRI